MHVAVFGSSAPKEGDPAYAEAYRLGRALAQAGHTVLNGGYIGTMEAVSRGAREAGGTVIGVACEAIERWRPVAPNPWLSQVWHTRTLMERLERLLTAADAAVVLPGSVGTWAEMLLWWNHGLIQAWPPKPLLLYGPQWAQVWAQVFSIMGEYFRAEHRDLLTFVSSPDQVVRVLTAFEAGRAPWSGPLREEEPR